MPRRNQRNQRPSTKRKKGKRKRGPEDATKNILTRRKVLLGVSPDHGGDGGVPAVEEPSTETLAVDDGPSTTGRRRRQPPGRIVIRARTIDRPAPMRPGLLGSGFSYVQRRPP